ncbi:tetratricopeptide repeat protein [Catellatospora tritici]|uniref:tetratricopeptide repeat protein n=1 Tax=Catellatospora tritici TaxID=2851566 RepID=UPI001C2D50C1|nr:tetratricopeptide repeat protein [Catellatospora tritici]MBV1853637.1 tetratricopeptide repeat protein [Catellatospora tritici]
MGRRDPRLDDAHALYEASVFYGDDQALDKAAPLLDQVEADLALARGRLLHARYLRDRDQEDPAELPLFERAAELYRQVGDRQGEAEALFYIGIYHQVLHNDGVVSKPYLDIAEHLAEEVGDRLLLSYVVRHIGFVHQYEDGDLDRARQRQEQSLALRREVGHLPGAAAALLALAGIAGQAGDTAERERLLDEAERTATEAQAQGVLRWIAAERSGADD